jgi:hypothetical protein
MVEESPLSGVILQVLSELDAGLVLCKTLFASTPGVSRLRNQWGPYLGSTHMVIRKLHELHEYGWDSLRSKSLPSGPYLGKRSLYRAPTNAEMFLWLAPISFQGTETRVSEAGGLSLADRHSAKRECY